MEYNITYRKKDKGIQAIISYKDIYGKWKQKSKQGFRTQKEAKPWINKTLKEIEKKLENQDVNNDLNEITFKELAQDFLKHEELYKEYNTLKGYKNAIAAFAPIKDIRVCNIKKANIRKCVDELFLRGLSKETIKTYLRRIKLIFNYYIENYNPSFDLDLKFKIKTDLKEKNKKALTKSQLDNLLNSKKLQSNKFYIVAYIAAKSGLRCGEILGLTWSDIDRNNMTLNVNKQWKVLKDTHKSGFGTLKSRNSYRKVPITTDFIKYLDIYKSENVLSIDGRIAPFNEHSIDKYLNPVLKDLAGITLHELRHTYITLLVASNNLDFKTIAKIAGHDVEQTIKTYSHVTDDMMNRAHKIISKIF